MVSGIGCQVNVIIKHRFFFLSPNHWLSTVATFCMRHLDRQNYIMLLTITSFKEIMLNQYSAWSDESYTRHLALQTGRIGIAMAVAITLTVPKLLRDCDDALIRVCTLVHFYARNKLCVFYRCEIPMELRILTGINAKASPDPIIDVFVMIYTQVAVFLDVNFRVILILTVAIIYIFYIDKTREWFRFVNNHLQIHQMKRVCFLSEDVTWKLCEVDQHVDHIKTYLVNISKEV